MTVPKPLSHLSLFSGIGGIDLAAEWTGFTTVAFCERDPFCQKVLAKHWPGVPIHADISTYSPKFSERITLVSGGFPCQDVSVAGRQVGVEGARTGLFRQMLRVVREVRPDFVLLENVSGLIVGGGIGTVLGCLAEMGLDAIWGSVLVSAVGGFTYRERVFILAHSPSIRCEELESAVRNTYQDGREHSKTTARWHLSKLSAPARGVGGIRPVPNDGTVWLANGVPSQLDGYRAYGNAVVPQQVYPILKAVANHLVLRLA